MADKLDRLLSDEERGYFTVVFKGDIRSLPTNPFAIESAFGEPVASGYGHAFREIDRLEDRLVAAAPALLDFAKALDASWTETFPDGPDADYSNSIIRMRDEHLALWRQCRAAIRSATEEGQ